MIISKTVKDFKDAGLNTAMLAYRPIISGMQLLVSKHGEKYEGQWVRLHFLVCA
jgi:hypothetical protein